MKHSVNIRDIIMILHHMKKIPVYTVSFYPENPITCWKTVYLILMVHGMETTPDNKIYILNKCSDSDRLWNATRGKNKQQKIRTNNINFYRRTMVFVTPEKATETNCIYITCHGKDHLTSRGAKRAKYCIASLFSSKTSLDLGQELSAFLTTGKYATSWKMPKGWSLQFTAHWFTVWITWRISNVLQQGYPDLHSL